MLQQKLKILLLMQLIANQITRTRKLIHQMADDLGMPEVTYAFMPHQKRFMCHIKLTSPIVDIKSNLRYQTPKLILSILESSY